MKRLKSPLVFICCLCFYFCAQAQYPCSVRFYISGNDDFPISAQKNTYQLIKNDSAYRVLNTSLSEVVWELDSLPAGNYTLRMTADSMHLASFYQVKLDSGNVYSYNIHVSKTRERRSVRDSSSSSPEKMEVSLNMLYGHNRGQENMPRNFNELYSGEFAYNWYTALSRFYTIGGKMGLQYAKAPFYNDTSRYLGERTLEKFYSSLIITMGYMNRFTFYNNKLPHREGLKLDVGINYNLPLFFKEVLRVNDDTRLVTRYIHRFNDVSAMVRLAYKYVGVQADYHPFAYLRSAYIEAPKLRVGVVFLIPITD